jgi:phosphoglycerate dehydrogenase-like enzyme
MGWFPVIDMIRARLSGIDTIRVRDFTRPVAEDLADADVILPSNCPIDAATIRALPDLQLIQQPAAGYEGIDLAAAKDRGIPVCNAPGANRVSVAENALLLMLALARRLKTSQRMFAQAIVGEPIGFELAGKTLGLVGKGKTGGRLAQIASGLEMNVLSVGSASTRDELHAMLARSDFVSIHCPLDQQTRGLFDAGAFAAMKPGAILINCARGAIIDRAALEDVLKTGKLGGVGLDVYWVEPWDPLDPLYRREDVLALPHIAGSTREALGKIADVVAENVRRFARGEELIHRIA